MTGLSDKQEAFAREVVKLGGSNTKGALSNAYRAVYSVKNMKDKSIWDEASRVAARPGVAQRIKQLQRKFKVIAEKKFEITAETVLGDLYEIKEKAVAEGKYTAAVAALKSVADISGFGNNFNIKHSAGVQERVKKLPPERYQALEGEFVVLQEKCLKEGGEVPLVIDLLPKYEKL